MRDASLQPIVGRRRRLLVPVLLAVIAGFGCNQNADVVNVNANGDDGCW